VKLYPRCPVCEEDLPLPVGNRCPFCEAPFAVAVCEGRDCLQTVNLTELALVNHRGQPTGEVEELCADCHATELRRQQEATAARIRRTAAEEKVERKRVNALRGVYQDATSPDLSGELPTLKSIKGSDALCADCRAIVSDKDAALCGVPACQCRCKCGLRFKRNWKGTYCPWCDERHGGEYGDRDEVCGRSNLICECADKADRRAEAEAEDRGEDTDSDDSDNFDGEDE